MSRTEVVGSGEGQILEFKRSLALQREALEALAGMVNSDSRKGVVIFGVDSSGAAVGIEPGDPDRAQQSLTQHIRNKFEPLLICRIELVECEGKRLLILQAERGASTPYHEYDGRAFIREGSTTRQLSLSEKQTLLKRRDRDNHNGPWRCDGCGTTHQLRPHATRSEEELSGLLRRGVVACLAARQDSRNFLR